MAGNQEKAKGQKTANPGMRKDDGNKRIIAKTEGCFESELTDMVAH